MREEYLDKRWIQGEGITLGELSIERNCTWPRVDLNIDRLLELVGIKVPID